MGVYEQKRALGTASILAIGSANPSNLIQQSDFPDFYFRVTKTEHVNEEIKDRFRRICEKSGIKKRYMYIDEALVSAHPEIGTYAGKSLDTRREVMASKIPELGAAAAAAALKEWGRAAEEITHLIVGCTSGGSDQPGADYHIARILGLSPTVNRLGIYHQGCTVGASSLQLAKDLAENNAGARVLAICIEVSIVAFRGFDEDHLDSLNMQAFVADGAAAVVVGADASVEKGEKPQFDIVRSRQLTLPGTGDAIIGVTREVGMKVTMVREAPSLFATNVEAALRGVTDGDWNAMFWAMHYPGGSMVLDKVEAALGLRPEKLRASREVLTEFGNMGSASVWKILHEMRRWSAANGCDTNGEGCEWGVLCGFASGLTLDVVLLRAHAPRV